ncbi:MAG TPA: hypothetical protein VIK11_09650 [Tepidiformaceae bacterium]
MFGLNRRNRIIAVGVSAVGLLGGGSVALAANTSSLAAPLGSLAAKVHHGKGPGSAIRGVAEKDILAASGLTQAQVKAGLASGKSISQLITDSQGKPATVEATVLDDLKTRLDQAVAAKKITSEQQAAALAKAPTELDTFLNRVPKPVQKAPAKIAQVGLGEAAKGIGISPAALRSAMAGGKSAAQVAVDHGVTEPTLVSGMTTAVDARIDAALGAGKIDAARAATMKAGIASAATKLVNQVPYPKAGTK